MGLHEDGADYLEYLACVKEGREMIRKYGWVRQKLDHRDAIYRWGATATIQDIDLRSSPWNPPIWDQGEIGSCTAHYAAYGFYYCHAAEGKKNFMPSRLYNYFMARSLEGPTNRDDGAEVRDCVKSAVQFGFPDEKDWPYETNLVTVRPSKAVCDSAKVNITIQYSSVPQKLNSIISCLTHKIPVGFGFNCYRQFENVGADGIVKMPSPTEQPIGGHCCAIVGAKTTEEVFICRNSWSEQWGDKGFFYIPFEYLMNTDLASDFWAMFTTT
jgi:C1A family cysteine protease